MNSEDTQIAAAKIMSYLKNGQKSEEPELVIVSGALAAGKTTFIRKNYSDNYVWIDPCRIFVDLLNTDNIGALKADTLIDFIGTFTMDLAILERKNIVMEILGINKNKVKEIIQLFTDIGYKVKIEIIKKSVFECYRNSLKRKADSLSCFFFEERVYNWIDEIFKTPDHREMKLKYK